MATAKQPTVGFRTHTGRVFLVALVVALGMIAAVSIFAADSDVVSNDYAIPEVPKSQEDSLQVNPVQESDLEGEVDVTEEEAEFVPETGIEENATLEDLPLSEESI